MSLLGSPPWGALGEMIGLSTKYAASTTTTTPTARMMRLVAGLAACGCLVAVGTREA